MIEPMRYALVFALLGVCLVVLAVQAAWEETAYVAWLIGGIEGYLAISMFTLALIYSLHEREVTLAAIWDHPVWRRLFDVLLFPYRILAWIVVGIARRFDSMELMNPVGTRLYVGRLPRPADGRRLAEAGVTSVLNLCIEFPVGEDRNGQEWTTAYLPLLDGAAPSKNQFQTALDWIAHQHANGHTILIHCAQGRGRSVTVAAAALYRLGLARDPDDALAAITAARPKARPSSRQRYALKRFCAQLGSLRATA